MISSCFAFKEFELVDSINALEAEECFKYEGGVMETWNASHPELEWAGVVAVVKTTIYTRSLLLPYYTNYAQLHYIIQGCSLQSLLLYIYIYVAICIMTISFVLSN